MVTILSSCPQNRQQARLRFFWASRRSFRPSSSISILLRLFGLFLVLDAAFWILGARRTSDDMASRAPGLLTG